jgi:hypothetical protein
MGRLSTIPRYAPGINLNTAPPTLEPDRRTHPRIGRHILKKKETIKTQRRLCRQVYTIKIHRISFGEKDYPVVRPPESVLVQH